MGKYKNWCYSSLDWKKNFGRKSYFSYPGFATGSSQSALRLKYVASTGKTWKIRYHCWHLVARVTGLFTAQRLQAERYYCLKESVKTLLKWKAIKFIYLIFVGSKSGVVIFRKEDFRVLRNESQLLFFGFVTNQILILK